jgi:hypothetical protein
VVPCHRALGKNGKLTGYHWGITRARDARLGGRTGRPGEGEVIPAPELEVSGSMHSHRPGMTATPPGRAWTPPWNRR